MTSTHQQKQMVWNMSFFSTSFWNLGLFEKKMVACRLLGCVWQILEGTPMEKLLIIWRARKVWMAGCLRETFEQVTCLFYSGHIHVHNPEASHLSREPRRMSRWPQVTARIISCCVYSVPHRFWVFVFSCPSISYYSFLMKAGGAVVERAQWVADSADLVNTSKLHQREGSESGPLGEVGPIPRVLPLRKNGGPAGGQLSSRIL